MIEHLDRIENLGFTININWNKWVDIIYEVSDVPSNSSYFPTDIRVLACSYLQHISVSFEDMVETTCDFFYMWYNKNIEKIKDYEMSSSDTNFNNLNDSILGDITKQVYRDFNIDNLLD